MSSQFAVQELKIFTLEVNITITVIPWIPIFFYLKSEAQLVTKQLKTLSKTANWDLNLKSTRTSRFGGENNSKSTETSTTAL